MKYPLVFYVKTLPPNVGGGVNLFVIRILEKYRDDYGIYKHELVHVKQWAVSFAIGLLCAAIVSLVQGSSSLEMWWLFALAGGTAHGLMYLVLPSYRLWAEVQAFREQAKHYTDDRKPLFATYISVGYKLKVTAEQALALLRK
jgi:hypothetical protein